MLAKGSSKLRLPRCCSGSVEEATEGGGLKIPRRKSREHHRSWGLLASPPGSSSQQWPPGRLARLSPMCGLKSRLPQKSMDMGQSRLVPKVQG